MNCSKVRFFNKRDYQTYQSFEILALLDEGNSREDFNKAVSMYFKNKDDRKIFREDRVIRRIISILASKNNNFINTDCKERLFKELLCEETLSTSNEYYFRKVYKIMCNEGLEEEFFERLDSLATDVNFNSYHYQLMRFYKKLKRKDFDENFLWKEIEKRKVFSLI